MEGGTGTYNPKTPAEVFKDVRGRRAGLIKALTTEAEKFYQLCDPRKENLCLYGLPNETWEVNLPAEEIPPELPEPTLGINFARDGMDEKDWLSLVAIHSDAWLLGVAFYFGAHFGFDEDARRRLFQKINRLPTIFEVVSGTAKKQTKGKTTKKKQTKEKTSDSNGSNSKPSRQSEIKTSTMALPREVDDGEGGEDGEEDEDEHGSTLCGACGNIDADDEFWIGCDGCEGWFHGKCVGITPESAEYVRVYKCPACSSHKRGRA